MRTVRIFTPLRRRASEPPHIVMSSQVSVSIGSALFVSALAIGLGGCSVIFSPELPESTDDQDAGGRTCTTSADCATEGETFVCGASNTCVNVLNATCTSIAGQPSLQNPDTIVFGSLLPTEGDNAIIGVPIQNAQDLAVTEVNASGGTTRGDIAVVNCDSGGDTDQSLDVIDHLVNTVGVPAILGPAFSGVVSGTWRTTTGAGVMTISPSATSADITGLLDDDLVWRTAASDAFQSGAIADLVRCRRTAEPSITKIVGLGKNDTYGRGLLNSIRDALGPELGQDNFADTFYDNPAEVALPDYEGAITAVLSSVSPDSDPANPEAIPDIAIILGTTEVAEVLQRFEARVRTIDLTGTSTVRYIMADGGRLDAVRDLIVADPTLEGRIEGTEPDHENGATFETFRGRYGAAFDGDEPGIFAQNSYDSVYLLALAVSALDSTTSITGSAIATAMDRLVSSGLPATPGDYSSSRNTLSLGGEINYEGASGPLDFDDNGEAGTDVVRWRYVPRQGSYEAIQEGSYPIDEMGTGTWSMVPGTTTCN